MSRLSEYDKLFGFRNKSTGKMILYYWASSQKHKALFSSQKKAEEAARYIDGTIEIVEI